MPVWAEAASRTSWNPRHIAERYGLFTIIILVIVGLEFRFISPRER